MGVVGCGDHARMSIYPSLRQAFGGSPADGLPSLVATHEGEDLPPLRGELVAIAELREPLGRRIASFHGAREVYKTHRDLLRNADVDCVIVVLHPKFQADVAIDCLEAGKHVWVEKPPAETLEGCVRMKEAAEAAGRILMVGFMKRYSPAYMRARKITRLPGFGELSMYEARYTYGQYPVDVYNFLNGFCVHHLDLPRFFMGDVRSVHAERVSRGHGQDGYGLLLRFHNDAVGLINVNCLETNHNNQSERVGVVGVGSQVFVENWRRVIAWVQGEAEKRVWEPDDIRPADTENSLYLHGYVGEIREFLDCIVEGRSPESDIANALEAIRLQEAAELSLERKGTVELQEVDRDV